MNKVNHEETDKIKYVKEDLFANPLRKPPRITSKLDHEPTPN